MKLVFATVSPPAIASLLRAERELKAEFGVELTVSLFYTISDMTPEKRQTLTERIAEADLTFVDMMGSPPRICAAVEAGLQRTQGSVIPYGGFGREYLRLGAFKADSSAQQSGKKPDMAKMKKMAAMAGAMPGAEKMMPRHVRDKIHYGELLRYFTLADPDNIRQMLLLILAEYGGAQGLPAPKPPRAVPAVGICLPGGREYFDSWTDFCRRVPYDANKPLTALLFYGTTYPRDNSAVMQALMDRMRRVTNVLPVALSGVEAVNDGSLRALLTGGVQLDAIVNTMSFRFSAGPMGGDSAPGVDILRAIDAPYLHPFTMTRRTLQEWSESVQGATASEVMISVMLPEMDGATDIMPVGVRCDETYDAEHDVTVDEMVLVPERAEMFVSRLDRLLVLRRKPNAEKKLAILCYNYPPGEGNLFGGAFLDTIESVCGILRALREAGYATAEVSPQQLKALFLGEKLVNSPRYGAAGAKMPVWNGRDYAAWLHAQPFSGEMEAAWGKAPGEIMTDENGDLQLPGVQLGNVWIGLQPSRGTGDDSAAYHDRTRPPHHQYLAYYAYLRQEFGADALIHVGTHGTLEFLKGKEAAMSGECWPDRLIGDVPHFYLYYCGNSAEAVIARRRSNASLVSYMPPVFVESGLYDEYKELDDLLQEHERAQTLYPASVPALLARIRALGEKLKLPSALPELETALYRMKHSLIPYGLHVFGQAYTPEEAAAYAAQTGAEDAGTLKRSASDARELPSLLHALSGGYIEPGIGGDIYRTPEVLPSGRNLYQFDQRLVPSPTAMQRGGEIARQTLGHFAAEGGTTPGSVAVILWGLETSRTQGETIGQILYYWGVRCRRGAMGKKVYEIIPLAELGRPRIDVTINICGFFRDMFPTLIDELTDLLAQLTALPEPDAENHIKAHTKQIYAALIREGYDEDEASELARARIFGPEEGSYGTGLTSIIEQKAWDDEAQLGDRFLTALRHVYTRDLHGRDVQGLYEQNLSSVEIVSQIRDNQEYEITDLDHYYEFFGGLSKSVELVRGEKAQMYVSDTTGREIVVHTAKEAIGNGLRQRILNPRWREGLLQHDYHGGQKIAERFENIMGLAATTGMVENWMFDELNAAYVENEATREALIENNRYAYIQMLEQMLEYYNRHYWDADKDAIERIKELYRRLEDAVEEES